MARPALPVIAVNCPTGGRFVESLGSLLRQHPRIAAALAFGIITAAVTHFAWLPSARMSGAATYLTVSAGLAHALAGALTGRRLLDGARTGSSAQAALIGAGTSLLAALMFAAAFAILLSRGNHSPTVMSYLLLAVFTAIFSFLGAGWALLLVSAGVGWGLFRLAAPQPPA